MKVKHINCPPSKLKIRVSFSLFYFHGNVKDFHLTEHLGKTILYTPDERKVIQPNSRIFNHKYNCLRNVWNYCFRLITKNKSICVKSIFRSYVLKISIKNYNTIYGIC